MQNLSIKLRDGFRNDTVTVTANGKEVFHKAGVSTDLTISYADGVEIPVADAVVQLAVAVDGGESETAEIRVQDTPFVDVWLKDGKLELRSSKEEVPML